MVDSVSTTTSGALSALATGGKSGVSNVDFDTFLKLLVSQLKNQDPLNPMDGTQFTSQIAQFSQLEQTIKGNAQLEKISQQSDYTLQGLAVNSIGKEVLMPGNSGQLQDGAMDFGYKLAKPAAHVEVEIINASGQTIRSYEVDGKAGTHTISWDGKDDSGDEMADGAFTLRMSATDFEGEKLPVDIYTYSVVSQVNNDGKGNITVATSDGRSGAFDNVLSIRGTQLANN